ncbi:hypothetical protein EPK99_15620 [Neorhizobium lilium]|uniref:Uncharacterized protein n=1 Tax=Neorhizobium lilium TaxID=2503024 RepID=A0A3S4UML5_9HYPH|nr:hypothetical protein [Neorhizobium lilium]RWX77082.1 hypothetical protein EPK99_15620 [Neorhizobium lilium]
MMVLPTHGQGIEIDMQPPAYLDNETYFAGIDRLENIARNFEPAAPDDLRTRIIEAVGDLGVWPKTCLPLSVVIETEAA